MTTSALEQPSARSTLRLPQRTRTRRPPARNRPQPRSCIRGKQQSRCRYRVPCNSGAPAVVSRARRALLLSCAQGSVADSRRGTPAPDDLRARVAERSGRPQTDGSRREPTIRSDDSCSSAAGAPPTDARALALGRERASCAPLPAQTREAVVVGEMRVPRAKQERALVRVTRLLVVRSSRVEPCGRRLNNHPAGPVEIAPT
jgi:hypothetical protein